MRPQKDKDDIKNKFNWKPYRYLRLNKLSQCGHHKRCDMLFVTYWPKKEKQYAYRRYTGMYGSLLL